MESSIMVWYWSLNFHSIEPLRRFRMAHAYGWSPVRMAHRTAGSDNDVEEELDRMGLELENVCYEVVAVVQK